MKWLLALLILLPLPALAQTVRAQLPVTCFVKRDQFVSWMGQQAHEAPKNNGVTNAQDLLETWTSIDGGTWTVTIFDPNTRLTCVLAAGKDWQPLLWYIPGQRAGRGDG